MEIAKPYCGDGCTTLWLHYKTLTCALEMGECYDMCSIYQQKPLEKCVWQATDYQTSV